MRSTADLAHVRDGDVLVCATFDPAWTAGLPTIAALVTETGGLSAPSKRLARERGIPAVQLPGATTSLSSETPTTVDGSAGTIEIRAT